jgi:PAS domain S-box-containing protein
VSTKHPPAPPFVRSIEHLMDFVDTATIGLHWVAADGTILWANPADYEMLGYTAEEYIGRNISEFHVDGPVITDILQRLTAGERLTNQVARLRCKDGSIRDVEITSSVLFDEDGSGKRFVHTRCFTQDITDRRRMEQARERFVGILGHDLRNPLSAISLAAEHLMKADDLPARHARAVARMAKSADRMSRMIADLIDFARRLGRGFPLHRAPMDMGEVVRRVLDESEAVFLPAVVAVHTEGELAGAWDADRVAQVVTNLVSNALQHGAAPYVVTVRGETGAVILQVSNAGAAIPPDMLKDIFEPFSQSTSTDGLGLGLYIVSEIVNAHGGCIEVSSDENQTVFSTRWPR